MRYQVIMSTGVCSMYAPDRECAAAFAHMQHTIVFCDHLTAMAYVVDCFDDTVVYANGK